MSTFGDEYQPNEPVEEYPASDDVTASFRNPSFSLSEFLVSNLEHRGLKVPTEVQSAVIPKIRETRGKDICVNAPTGSGKTLAYVLPIVEVFF